MTRQNFILCRFHFGSHLDTLIFINLKLPFPDNIVPCKKNKKSSGCFLTQSCAGKCISQVHINMTDFLVHL